MQSWDADEVLEDFYVDRTSELDWAQPATSDVFCSAPIPRPLEIYHRLERYLEERNALKSPDDFLNGAGRLSRFLEYASSSMFLLSTGPAAITDLVVAELQEQGVPYSLQPTRGREVPPITVRLGSHGFFCERASAEFDLN